MIEVREVRTRRERREFLEFPNKLYKGCPYYVPPLYMDERKIFRKDYVYYDTCEAVYFNAYKDGVMAGRISGIIQRASNEKWGQKRVRFTRFETVRDFEVAKALFRTVEEWAVGKGTKEACGPMGFSDFEREGLLTDGFDQMSTFEEAYNYDYYPEFIERLGYVMETEWEESQIRLSKDPEQLEEMEKMAAFVLKRYKLHLGPSKNGKDFLKRYADGFFEIVDKSYDKIYGTVPFTEGMKKMAMDNFALILDNKHAGVVLDENDRVIALGLCFPCIARPMQVAGGHLTPLALLKTLKAIKHPDVIDLGLIGVDPAYLNCGVSIVIANELARMLKDPHIKYADTNLNLVDNAAIINLWKRFDAKKNKHRKAYVKKLV